MLADKIDESLREELKLYSEAWRVNKSKEGKCFIDATVSLFLGEFILSQETYDKYYDFYIQLKNISQNKE
jgi:hypothetical protein